MALTPVSVPDLKAGMIVHNHGGRFYIEEDATPAQHHMSGVYVAKGLCLSGEVPGYFKRGKVWTFQGNAQAWFAVGE